jgi:hypothetical protein
VFGKGKRVFDFEARDSEQTKEGDTIAFAHFEIFWQESQSLVCD